MTIQERTKSRRQEAGDTMLDRHIYLTGMPGCGKTSLGKKIAKETGLPFADLDDVITKAAGMTVNEIFATWGEEAFRRAETNALCTLTRAFPMIISTGGGTVINTVNRKIMRCWGRIVLVDRPLEDILGDVRTDSRPLLHEGGEEAVRRLYAERERAYRESADYAIVNSGDYLETVRKMIRLLRDRFGV